jgi:hypothetical protein
MFDYRHDYDDEIVACMYCRWHFVSLSAFRIHQRQCFARVNRQSTSLVSEESNTPELKDQTSIQDGLE